MTKPVGIPNARADNIQDVLQRVVEVVNGMQGLRLGAERVLRVQDLLGAGVVTTEPQGGLVYTPPTGGGGAVTSVNGATGVVVLESDDINYLQAGTGAVVRDVRKRLRDVLSAKDFGVTGDGVTDDTAAIQTFINALQAISTPAPDGASEGAVGVFPAGAYVISDTITITEAIRLQGAGYGDNSISPDGQGRGGTAFLAASGLAGKPMFRILPAAGVYCTGGQFKGFSLQGLDFPSYGLHASCISRWQIDIAAFRCRVAGVRCDDNGSAVYSFANEWWVHYNYGIATVTRPSHGLWFIGSAAGNPQQIVHKATGLFYNGDGLRIEDEVDNLQCYHAAFARAPGGTGYNLAFRNSVGPSVPRINTIHYVAGGFILAEAGSYGNRVATSSETTTISGTGQLHYEVTDYVTAGLWKTRHFWMSDTMRFSANEFTLANVGGAPVQAQLGGVFTTWTLPKTPGAVYGVSTGRAAPPSWGAGRIVAVEVDFAIETAHNQGNVRLSAYLSTSAPGIGDGETGGGATTSVTAPVGSSAVRRREKATVALSPAVDIAQGDYVFLIVQRDSAAGADVLNQPIHILGATLLYEATGPSSGGSGTFVVPPMGS